MKRLAAHWPEYLIEATCLALFMISAAAAATVLQHPASPFAGWGTTPLLQRIPMGIAMGLTAVALIYSPLGARSGAHMNPAVTLTFLAPGEDRARRCGGVHHGAIRRWSRRHCGRDVGPRGTTRASVGQLRRDLAGHGGIRNCLRGRATHLVPDDVDGARDVEHASSRSFYGNGCGHPRGHLHHR